MCLIQPTLFETFFSELPLFPGKQNHWVLALRTTTDDRELIGRAVTSFMGRHGPPDIEQLEVTGVRVGDPEKIRGRIVSKVGRGFDVDFDAALPEGAIYVAIAFTQLGAERSWPWTWEYDECPENVTEGVYAVYKAAASVHIPTSFETILENIDRTGGQIADDAGHVADEAGQVAREGLGLMASALTALGLGLIALELVRKR